MSNSSNQVVTDNDVAVAVDAVFDKFEGSEERLTTTKLVAMTIAALPNVRGTSTLVSDFVRRNVREGKLVGKRGRTGCIARSQRLSAE